MADFTQPTEPSEGAVPSLPPGWAMLPDGERLTIRQLRSEYGARLQDAPGDGLIAVQFPGLGLTDDDKDFLDGAIVLIGGYFLNKVPMISGTNMLARGAGGLALMNLEKRFSRLAIRYLNQPSPVHIVTIDMVRHGKLFFDR